MQSAFVTLPAGNGNSVRGHRLEVHPAQRPHLHGDPDRAPLPAFSSAGTVGHRDRLFDWPGIGQYAYISILRSDYNAVMGFTVWAGLMFIFVNYCVDVVHRFIDPRE